MLYRPYSSNFTALHFPMAPPFPLRATLLFFLLAGLACREQKRPDVSRIQVNLEVTRFERDFFSLDTNQLEAGLYSLEQKYPVFLPDFFTHISGIPWTGSEKNPQHFAVIKQFLHDYRSVFDSTEKNFADIRPQAEEIRAAMRLIKYYFPEYPLPNRWITYIGPFDAIFQASLGSYSDVLMPAGIASGLQLHLGASSPIYQDPVILSLYPAYLSRNFSPATMAVNAIKNLIDNLYPEQVRDRPLLEQMIEKGKRLYLLDQFMPDVADTLKIGYTHEQLEGCYRQEGRIWNFFMSSNLLYNSEPGLIKNYIHEGPQTPELGQGSPGYIGLFVGRQIVEAFMQRHPETSLKALLATDARKLYEASKYHP